MVGCGLGDDAEAVAALGFAVTAFDVSPTAIAWARRRFPASRVTYRVADLFAGPPEWIGAFDLIVEIHTLQALPPDARTRAMPLIARCLKPGGRLVVITRGREPDEPEGDLPWPLTRRELAGFGAAGLTEVGFEESNGGRTDDDARRWLLIYRAPVAPTAG